MSGPRRSEAHCFNENSSHPSLPGEETAGYINRINTQSPALTPRRSSVGVRGSTTTYDAPLRFEPEGCCGTNSMESNSPPACLRWARNLHSLLQDPEGLELFKKYLEQEVGQSPNPLNFWFACEGLKEEQDPDKMHHLVKLIHKRFILKMPLNIPEQMKKDVNRRIKEGRIDRKVFDAVQLEVERLINETTYPNFLHSEIYLQYVHACQNPDYSAGYQSSNSSREMSLSCGPSLLPTLHEDSEFTALHTSHSACDTPSELRLTKDVLMATQKSRAMDVRPHHEAYAGIYLQPGTSPYHMSMSSRVHVQYSSYNPVSRQDSELQSLSSGRTESDNLSLTDSSVDGMSIGRSKSSKKQSIRDYRAMKQSANLNRDPMAHHTIIPRTQRVSRDLTQPLKPELFAQVLIDKLESVKRNRENQEKLDKHLKDIEVTSGTTGDQDNIAPPLTDTLKDKLVVEDENDQAILDQHISRIWSDLTPARSPGLASPRPNHSPERKKLSASSYHLKFPKARKDKDGFSTFSGDSGNNHDFPEGSEFAGASSISSASSYIPKSKSIPLEFAETLHKSELHYTGHEIQRFRRSDSSRRSATKKSLTETDSGVSVVSDSKDRMQMWRGQMERKVESKRHSKRHGSRSGSLERPPREEFGGRPQPFLGDPGMPPLPQPHVPTQLEEASRRLKEAKRGSGSSGSCGSTSSSKRYSSSSKPTYESHSNYSPHYTSSSNQSTLRKSKDTGDFTTVVFNFCDEQFPYRSKIPGHNVTLKQFKEYLPKKGSYRYFFKTECEDLDTKVIQEEITDDAEILPLWEGKVMAQVKAFE